MSTASLPVTGRRLHVAAEHHDRDLDAAEAAANAFLTALGIDQEALAETPARMAKAYAELLTPREFDLTTFDNDEGYEQLILVQGIPFRSLCEHHALPFIGTADVGYLPGKRIIGLSKLARVVELFAHRELLAESHTVVEEVQRHLTPADVRRLYPDAYGRDYVARRDDYLTSAPVTVFILLASPSAIGRAKDIKSDIRRLLGDGDALRNHLHMPDSPGDAFADLDHLAGTTTFSRLYERYERDRAAQRLARYRALLEQPDPRHRTG